MKFEQGTFGYDLAFLKKHLQVFVLRNPDDSATIAVAPAYQGRVMTSSANGYEGKSFGWINHDLIASGKKQPKINAVGGEERFWLGPEGGQFGLFFPPQAPFDFEHWQTPAPLDTIGFVTEEFSDTAVSFIKEMHLKNYADFDFHLLVNRKIEILQKQEVAQKFDFQIPENLKMVAYESHNKILNLGVKSWTEQTGMLSIWILGMFNPSPKVTIFIPFREKQGTENPVTDDYFGKIPPERLKISNGMVFFKGDGKQRGKIGIPPAFATSRLGSYDAENQTLTVVQFNRPDDQTRYVNSLWKMQENPFGGDVVNAYNDGKTDDGTQLGPFYELETSSPAAALNPGETIAHQSLTCHFCGNPEQLNAACMAIFGVSINDVKNAFSE